MNDDRQALIDAFEEMKPALELLRPAMERGDEYAVRAWAFYNRKDEILANVDRVLANNDGEA